MELADRVKLKRQELEMYQDELASRMGYKSRTSINKIEMGRPVSQKIIVRLAESLGVTPSYLMGWEDEENEIRPIDITHLYEKMAKQGFSSKTIIHERTVLRNIFNYRNFTDGTDYNQAAFVKPAKGKAPVVRKPVPEEAVIAVMQHTDGFGIVPCLFAFTGARLGEIMALQVSDIDFDRNLYGCKGSITISKSVQWQGGSPVIKEPKTAAGVREVPILDQFRPILLAAVKGLKKDDFVVSRCDKPLTARAYERRWQMYCREIGLAREIKIPSKRPQRNGKIYMITEYRATITAHPEQFRSRRWSGQHLQRHGLQESFHS